MIEKTLPPIIDLTKDSKLVFLPNYANKKLNIIIFGENNIATN